jgi:hypothetical protein
MNIFYFISCEIPCSYGTHPVTSERGQQSKFCKSSPQFMKYEMINLDIGNSDMGGFQNSKIIFGWPPLVEKY